MTTWVIVVAWAICGPGGLGEEPRPCELMMTEHPVSSRAMGESVCAVAHQGSEMTPEENKSLRSSGGYMLDCRVESRS